MDNTHTYKFKIEINDHTLRYIEIEPRCIRRELYPGDIVEVILYSSELDLEFPVVITKSHLILYCKTNHGYTLIINGKDITDTLDRIS